MTNALKEDLDSLIQLHSLAENGGMDLWRFTNRLSLSVKKFKGCENEDVMLAYAKLWLKRFELSVRIPDGAGLASSETRVCAQQVVYKNNFKILMSDTANRPVIACLATKVAMLHAELKTFFAFQELTHIFLNWPGADEMHVPDFNLKNAVEYLYDPIVWTLYVDTTDKLHEIPKKLFLQGAPIRSEKTVSAKIDSTIDMTDITL